MILLGSIATPAHAQSIKLLTSFEGGGDGASPYGYLTLMGKTLDGTTYWSGAYSDGTVFSVPTSGGGHTVLATFNGSSGSLPSLNLLLIGSTLYGTAEFGECQ